MTDLVSLAATVTALVAITITVGRVLRLEQGGDALIATLRAVVQLLAVGAVIVLIFTTPALAPLYLAVMVTAATITSARRLPPVPGRTRACAAAIIAGSACTAIVVFGLHALPLNARNAVPLIAQLVGGAMTATTLAGLRLADDVTASWEQVEGWLALGATAPQAIRPLGRLAAGRALVPTLDQTRNVGLVVLPGAFVGLLLGGATPAQAGRVQLLVLVGLLTAQTISATLITLLLARPLGTRRPAE